MPVSRRAVIAAAALAPLAVRLGHAAEPLIRRPIPSTGEMLPAIGIGTSRRYEVEPTPDAVAPLKAAVQTFVALGGTVIDTAPSYGTAEDVLGLILAEPGLRQKVFLASKVDTTGRDQTLAEFERSLKRMEVEAIDLVAVHNLIDVNNNLAVLRDLKGQKRIRYVGVTVWRDNQLDALEAVMNREALDFIQVNYAIDNRAAAERVLPLAADRGVAVMTNVPFGRDRLFKAVQGKDLPGRGQGSRLRELAAVLPQVRARQSGRDLPNPRDGQGRVRRGQPRRRPGPAAGSGPTQADGDLHRCGLIAPRAARRSLWRPGCPWPPPCRPWLRTAPKRFGSG